MFIKWMQFVPRDQRRVIKIALLLLTLYSAFSTLRWIWDRYLVMLLSVTWYRMGKAGWTPCGFAKFPFIQIIATNGVMVMWEANCRFDNVEIYYSRRAAYRSGPHQQLRQDEGTEHRLAAGSIEVSLQGKDRFIHRAYLDDLYSDSFYDYSVLLAPRTTHTSVRPRGPTTPFQATFYFPGEKAERVTLGVLSDNHKAGHVFSKLLQRMNRRNPEIMLHLGDMVHSARRAYEWQTFFFDPLQRAGKLTSRVPTLITMGNHDLAEHGIADYFAPANRVGNRNDRYYHSVMLGPIKIISLDCTYQEESQLHWLESELSSLITQKAPFRMVLFHTPPFIEFWDPDSWQMGGNQWSPVMRARLVTLLERYHVDLVLSGHQHNYQRGFKNGVHYITCGGAGGIIDWTRVEDHRVYKKTLFTHHYLILQASETAIEVHAYDLSDYKIDHVSVPRNIIRRYRAAE